MLLVYLVVRGRGNYNVLENSDLVFLLFLRVLVILGLYVLLLVLEEDVLRKIFVFMSSNYDYYSL